MRRQYKQSRRPRIIKGRKCYFCENKTFPVYKEVDVLAKFVSERGKIIARLKTGVCNKHQSILTKEVKRARFMAILPYVVRASA
ncbi:30S ribosomal protein S18 [Candidatus Gottesmanbacteria bacterium]|nr:30S ribosomal protein S18 [Candidatus Gottesmanbacteria bacterium]